MRSTWNLSTMICTWGRQARAGSRYGTHISMQTCSICWRSGISLRNRVTVALVRAGSNPMMVPARTLVKIHRCLRTRSSSSMPSQRGVLENASLLSFSDVIVEDVADRLLVQAHLSSDADKRASQRLLLNRTDEACRHSSLVIHVR